MEWLQPVFGLASASLVALIALGFGVMFVFFSGSAVLVLGHFLRYARSPRVALPALGAALVVTAASEAAVGGSPLYGAGLQLAVGALGFGAIRWTSAHRWMRLVFGLVLLGSGGLFVVSLALPELDVSARRALGVSLGLATVAGLGLWPFVIAGLARHYFERPVEWFLSLRYLVARRRQTFISIISVICATGVALGVAVIMVVLSVMNGFARVWEEKIVGTRAHFVVQSQLGPFEGYDDVRDRVAAVPGVLGATPFLQTEAIFRGARGEIQAVLLKGVDPATVGATTRLEQDLVVGSLGNLARRPDAEGDERLPGVIVGSELADRFLLQLHDPVILISPLGGPATPLGPAPRLEKFRVAGIFHSDFFQFDESFIYTDLPAAQRFMRIGDKATGIGARTADPYRSRAVADASVQELGPLFFARDWKEFYPAFYRALKMERAMMFVLLSFIMVVAGFIIISTLMMMIMEKSRDIAILKAMGCEDDGILRVFAIGGCLIGLAGLGLGLGMGTVIAWNLDRIQALVERTVGFDVLPSSIYQLGGLPYDIVGSQVALISLIAMVLSIGATLLPSWQAARLDPAEGLRYE